MGQVERIARSFAKKEANRLKGKGFPVDVDGYVEGYWWRHVNAATAALENVSHTPPLFRGRRGFSLAQLFQRLWT
ncbi:MAG: hypothetical protein HQL64_03420 [Magnetococcales bacterium]|nr:hypothetical protein [Magnetococcales bacterium]